jgi:hypothetical protein
MSQPEQPAEAKSGGDAPQPEQKFGPYSNGIGVAIWLNETNDGQRQFRSITISHRRYQDPTSGKWKDAKSFQPGDLPALMFALRQAQEYIIQHPLKNADAGAATGNEDIPF